MTSSSGSNFPPFIRNGLVVLLAGILAWNVFSRGDSALSLLIAAGLLAVIGVDQNRKGG